MTIEKTVHNKFGNQDGNFEGSEFYLFWKHKQTNVSYISHDTYTEFIDTKIPVSSINPGSQFLKLLRNKITHNEIPFHDILKTEINKLLKTGKLPDYEYKKDENEKWIEVRKAKDIDVKPIENENGERKPDRTDPDFCKNFMTAMFLVIEEIYTKISTALIAIP
jgi:hypothetical protein